MLNLISTIGIRGFDSVLKFSFYLFLPIFLSASDVGYIHLFLSVIFISSVFLRFSYENIILKKMTDLSLSKKNLIIFLKKNFIKFAIIYLILFVVFFLMNKSDFLNLDFSVPIINIFFNYNLNIVICSFVFTFITFISFALRGMGYVKLSIIIFGSIWVILLFSIILILYFMKLNHFATILNLFSTSYFISLLLIFFLFNYFFSKYKFLSQKKSEKLSYDVKSYYFQSINNVAINWFPILIFSFFNTIENSGHFATQFRIGVGLYLFLSTIDFLSLKLFSKNFQKKNYYTNKKKFLYFTKLKIYLAIGIFFSSLILFLVLENYLRLLILDEYFIIFLAMLLITSIFGPYEAFLNMTNKEKYLANWSLFFMILMSLIIFASISIFNSPQYVLVIFSIFIFLRGLFFTYKIFK